MNGLEKRKAKRVFLFLHPAIDNRNSETASCVYVPLRIIIKMENRFSYLFLLQPSSGNFDGKPSPGDLAENVGSFA